MMIYANKYGTLLGYSGSQISAVSRMEQVKWLIKIMINTRHY